jgi:hypothetical protein
MVRIIVLAALPCKAFHITDTPESRDCMAGKPGMALDPSFMLADRVKVPPLATQLALQHQAPGHTAAVSGLLESVWNDKDKDTGGHAQNVKGGDAWQGSKRPHTAVKDGPNRDQQPGHHSHHPPQQQQGTSPRGRK